MSFLLTACGGSDSSPPSFTIGGSVSGLLAGTSVVLANNGGNSTPVLVNASFSFSTRVGSGGSYDITVVTQPTGETCTVANASGVVGSANVSVAVTCAPNSYSIGGTVTGLLPGTSVSLSNASSGQARPTSNGPYTFNTTLESGTSYDISVMFNPTGETCTITNGTGKVVGNDVTNINVTCSAQTYSINANVFGLVPNSNLVLQDNASDNLVVSTGGTFAFKLPVASQSTYAVTVTTQPTHQSCFVTGGTGTVAAANITVTVVCPWHIMYIPDMQDNAILGYYIDPSSGSILSLASNSLGAPAGLSSPATLASNPNHTFLYAANQGSNSVAAYTIDPSTGALTPVAGSPFAAGSAPREVVIDSSGQFLYVANQGVALSNGNADPANPSSISAYAINQTTGALTPVTGSAFMSASSPSPIVADPAGYFLFASTGSYAIAPASGALAFNGASNAMGCANTTTSGTYCAAAVRSTGDYLYVGSSAFAINATTGVFAAVPGNGGVASSSSVVVSPNNQFLYLDRPSIGVDMIDPTTGLASPIGGSPFSTGSTGILPVRAYAVDPSGDFVYLTTTSGGGVSGFSLNASTGAPAQLAGSPFTQLKDAGVFGPGGYSIDIVALH